MDMAKESILRLMVSEHMKILKLLESFNKNIEKNLAKARKEFSKFREKHAKHIVLEEEALFKMYKPEDREFYLLIQRLVSEHNLFSRIENMMQSNLNEKTDISDFRKKMIGHQNLEEEKLYSRMDAELEESKKKEMIKRIRGNITK